MYIYVLKTNASLIVWLRALSHETFSGGWGGSGTEVKIQDAAGFLGVKSLVGKGLIIWMPGSEQMILTITSKICFYTSYFQPKMKIALFLYRILYPEFINNHLFWSLKTIENRFFLLLFTRDEQFRKLMC